MKIAVYGATGMVGREIVAEALARGHEVTAVTRTGSTVPGATRVGVDMADAAALAEIAAAHDAVVLATVPSRTGESHEPWVEAVIAAFGAVADTRLLVVGGADTLTVDGARIIDSPDFPAEYRPEGLTMARIYDPSSGRGRA
ncbi:NAD(P)-dependent oxidoreductase [Cryobacterium algoritolerans]|uniref:NAD(P)-dependent oxidoreductase n=1 Tax=Cryobacterium algoritolerans TaxID=1259184 RepID=UPI0030B9D5A0